MEKEKKEIECFVFFLGGGGGREGRMDKEIKKK